MIYSYVKLSIVKRFLRVYHIRLLDSSARYELCYGLQHMLLPESRAAKLLNTGKHGEFATGNICINNSVAMF